MRDIVIFMAGYVTADLLMPVVRRYPPFDRATSAMARLIDRLAGHGR